MLILTQARSSGFYPTLNPPISLTASYISSEANAERVFVKLVDRADLRPYGAEVHTHLAARGYAPQLSGHKILYGAPPSYAMEYLNDRWVFLFDLSVSTTRKNFETTLRPKYPRRRWSASRTPCRVMQALESRNKHCARRFSRKRHQNNTMIKLNDEGNLDSEVDRANGYADWA